MAVILLELFSGIGGFAEGFKQAGITIDKHYFSEVDKYAIANYQYNYDKAEYIGSVKHVRHIIRTINKHRKPTDQLIITSGSPCQDFSLAGKRAGLAGAKSSLLHFALVLSNGLSLTFIFGKMLKERSAVTMAQTFGQLSKPLPTLGVIQSNGNCLIQHGFYPKIESEFTLLDILEVEVSPDYFLSEKMIAYLHSRSNQTKDGHKPNIVEL